MGSRPPHLRTIARTDGSSRSGRVTNGQLQQLLGKVGPRPCEQQAMTATCYSGGINHVTNRQLKQLVLAVGSRPRHQRAIATTGGSVGIKVASPTGYRNNGGIKSTLQTGNRKDWWPRRDQDCVTYRQPQQLVEEEGSRVRDQQVMVTTGNRSGIKTTLPTGNCFKL